MFTSKRFTLTVNTREPKFEADDAAKDDSRRKALQDAKQKATLVADETGEKIEGVHQVEQLHAKASRSGMYGDDSWWPVTVAAGGAFAAEEDDETPVTSLSGASRTVQVSYRVRYRISD